MTARFARWLAVLLVVGSVAAGCAGGTAPESSTAASPSVGSSPSASASIPAASGSPASSGATASAATACPTSPPAPLAAGQTRTVLISTAKGAITIKVEGALAPLAAGNFVALASCGFYKGVVFHRLVPGFVIQGGDPTGSGSGGPGYTFNDEPVGADYSRGTVAMANAGPNTNGSQFFICLADLTGQLPKNYTIFGHVTTGMDVVDAIAAMPNSGQPDNRALQPVAMDSLTVSNP